jgi:cytochrome oxidase assembly protein ShyY1
LQLADGTVFIVDRGWVPSGDKQDKPDVVPAAPAGEVTVVARVQAGEPTIPGRTAPAGEIPSIDLPEVAKTIGQPTYTGAYGLLDSENPAPATKPLPALKPDEDEGPHLSYAIQWIVFALFGFAGLGYAIRQEYRARRSADPEEAHLFVPKARKRATDADIEDELAEGVRISR